MKKRIANIVEIVLILISYGMLWLPLVSLQYTKMMRELPVSVSPMGLNTKATVCVITIVCLINIVMCMFSIFTKKEYKDGIVHVIMPIVMFFYLASMNSFSVGKIIGEWTVVENRFPSTILLICMVCVIVVSIVKRSPLIVGLPKVEVKSTGTNADELQKYKNLLDTGAITQEEFDAKKKQLLDL